MLPGSVLASGVNVVSGRAGPPEPAPPPVVVPPASPSAPRSLLPPGLALRAPGTRGEVLKPLSERMVDVVAPGGEPAGTSEEPLPRPPGSAPRETVRGAASRRALSTGSWYWTAAGVPSSGSGDCGVCAYAGVLAEAAVTRRTATVWRDFMAVSVENTARAAGTGPPSPRSGGHLGVAALVAAAPVGLTGLLLLLEAWSQGAHALRHWAPVAVFVLVALACAHGAHPLRGLPLIAAAGLWGYAGWSLLSVLWADAPGRALEAGVRDALYAGLLTLPLTTVRSAAVARRLCAALVAGLAVIVVATYAAMLIDGTDLFLAGRLDDPVGYRNGTAALFALSFWPLVCVACVRQNNALLRAAAMALAVLALGLAFLTQSRGVMLGFVAGGAVAIALGPDRVRRVWFALLAAAALAAVAERLLTPYDAFIARRVATADDIAQASSALGIVAVVAFFVVLVLALLDGGLRVSTGVMQLVRRLAIGGLVALAVAGGAAAYIAVGNPITYVGDKIDEFGRSEQRADRQTRLGATGGPRAELYRVALVEFRSSPLTGVGQGNFGVGWYEERRNRRNLSDPHSLALGILAETGIVGALLFLTFLVAAVLTLARRVRDLPPDTRRWASAMAAAAAVAIAQASVDWLWLIPGVAGLALLCAGLALSLSTTSDTPGPERRRRGATRWVTAAVPAVAALLAGALYFSDVQVRKARAATTAEAQIDAARSAERFNPFAVSPHYLEAGALETLGRTDAARAELREALDTEPRSFVTLALLGDLEVRAGRRAEAIRYYRRALELNPLDTGLQQLAGVQPPTP